MNISFETRRKLKLAGKIALVALLILTVIWACWMVWLERYIIYTREGAVLDFGLTADSFGSGTLAEPPENPIRASVFFNDESNIEDLKSIMTQLDGYYITYDMLASDIDTVRAAISVLPVGSAVMVEVKSIKGSFYYSSKLEEAKPAAGLDIDAVDRLLEDMAGRNLYIIATLPAFRDRDYGLNHTNNGLPYVGGNGALWIDEESCYWMDPTKSGALNYLQSIATELMTIGFDEVMFTEFRFPETDQLDFTGDRNEAIQNAAKTLVEKCASDSFAVSFLASGSTVKAVEGRSRLYLENVDAAAASASAARYGQEDPAVGMVFITDSYDTRYEEFGVLRPITSFVGND